MTNQDVSKKADSRPFTLELVHPRDPSSIWALEQYYAELNARFKGGFEVSLSADPEVGDMVKPRGAFFLAKPNFESEPDLGWKGEDFTPLGCVALKGHGGTTAEVKRLWVSPSARKLGLGRALMDQVEVAAQQLGIKVLRLDTNSALPEAVAFYTRLGWTKIDRFNQDPYPDLFYKKQLS